MIFFLQPKMYVSETGWPTVCPLFSYVQRYFLNSLFNQASSDPATAKNGGGADASEANLQIFIDKFVCKANSDGLGYFFFEVGLMIRYHGAANSRLTFRIIVH
jgi:hypothetical protein